VARHVLIKKKGTHKQKYHGVFIADNGEPLAHTEKLTSKKQLEDMIGKYFPGWPVYDG